MGSCRVGKGSSNNEELSVTNEATNSCYHIILNVQLLDKTHSNRLGTSGRGFEDVKAHPFFRSINWNHLEQGVLEPPFTPNVSVASSL